MKLYHDHRFWLVLVSSTIGSLDPEYVSEAPKTGAPPLRQVILSHFLTTTRIHQDSQVYPINCLYIYVGDM